MEPRPVMEWIEASKRGRRPNVEKPEAKFRRSGARGRGPRLGWGSACMCSGASPSVDSIYRPPGLIPPSSFRSSQVVGASSDAANHPCMGSKRRADQIGRQARPTGHAPALYFRCGDRVFKTYWTTRRASRSSHRPTACSTAPSTTGRRTGRTRRHAGRTAGAATVVSSVSTDARPTSGRGWPPGGRTT